MQTQPIHCFTRKELNAYREASYDAPTPNTPQKSCFDCNPEFAAYSRRIGKCTQPTVVFVEVAEEYDPLLDGDLPPPGIELRGMLPEDAVAYGR